MVISKEDLKELNDSAAETWNSLSKNKQNLIVAALIWDITTKLAAWHLLFWRPKERIKGKKIWWFLATFIDGIGAPAFLLFGRKSRKR